MFCLILGSTGTAAVRAEGIEAVTRPSADVLLSFVIPGQVKSVDVKAGDVVEAGQVLVRLDDAAERAQLEQLKAQAEDETRIEAAEAQLAQRNLDLKLDQLTKLKKIMFSVIDLAVRHRNSLKIMIREVIDNGGIAQKLSQKYFKPLYSVTNEFLAKGKK